MQKESFVPFFEVSLKDGFWRDRYLLNKDVSIFAVKARFEESARFDALRFNYLKNGKPLHIFYDSDAAKWIEAVAYLLRTHREELAEEETFIDELVDCMGKAQREDGYLNSYFQQIEPQNVYAGRNNHELYCAGHLIEAAIAYDQATGKDQFLQIMERNCACIERAFFTEKTAKFQTPGHEEIELALFKLWAHTGKEKYRRMAEAFLSLRGANDKDEYIYGENSARGAQDDVPVYELTEANGHAVRAMYLYCAVADMALANGDERIKKALDRVWSDVTERKLYITGGIGSTQNMESFTVPYDLPNLTAYSESCGAIAFCLFAMRMRQMEKNAKYGALIERELYNNLLSSTSLDGKAFFYTNPLEIALEEKERENVLGAGRGNWLPITERLELFGCSCCPPNINRFFAIFPELICVDGEKGVTVEQYISTIVRSSFGEIAVNEAYATKGVAEIRSKNYKAKEISFRVPEWCRSFRVVKDGKSLETKTENGYITVSVDGAFCISLDFGIAPVFVAANPKVRANAGRVALCYGPTVYCLEGVDNGERLNGISVEISAAKKAKLYPDFHGLYSIELVGYRENADERLYFDASESERTEQKLKFIPYFAFSNRGESDMLVWVRRR